MEIVRPKLILTRCFACARVIITVVVVFGFHVSITAKLGHTETVPRFKVSSGNRTQDPLFTMRVNHYATGASVCKGGNLLIRFPANVVALFKSLDQSELPRPNRNSADS